MKIFFSFLCVALLFFQTTTTYGGDTNKISPDPSQYWGTLIFKASQIMVEGDIKPDTMCLQLVGNHAGWGSMLSLIDGVKYYEVHFFSPDITYRLWLDEEEYNLFRDIHITSEYLIDEFFHLIPGSYDLGEYHEIILNIAKFNSLKITFEESVDFPGEGYYKLDTGENAPITYLTPTQYDAMMVGLARTNILHYDKLNEYIGK